MDEQFTKYTHVNVDLDIATKRAALRASASVVGLISVRREGGETLFNASGTIYETSENGDGKYLSRIVTSASLFGSVAHKDIYIKVFTAGGIVFDGIVMGHDAHYNLAIIDIISDVLLPAARLRILDDSVSLDPISVQCSLDNARPHSRKFKICAGDMLVALGRSCKNFDIMSAAGKLR
ncbi:Unknown protein [Striga hermonthica]|uniref:Uncharacterized protein n=1 Tax=Striga hermonthica TaxID=68872 RepID=A0A9N7NW38_STRHE|nr:Unknown protein [Striga hermonthica]